MHSEVDKVIKSYGHFRKLNIHSYYTLPFPRQSIPFSYLQTLKLISLDIFGQENIRFGFMYFYRKREGRKVFK